MLICYCRVKKLETMCPPTSVFTIDRPFIAKFNNQMQTHAINGNIALLQYHSDSSDKTDHLPNCSLGFFSEYCFYFIFIKDFDNGEINN